MSHLSVNQKDAIKKLKKLRVGALFMEPGTGKTRTAIELIESSDTDFVLWIVPFQTKQNLKDELDKWHFNKKFQIIGVESIGSSDRIYLEVLKKIKQYNKAFIVVDESLKIKNGLAQRTQRVLELGKYGYYRLILNGTPLSKNILDLYTQMQFLSPKILNMSFQQYRNTFCEYTKFNRNGFSKVVITGYANFEYLYSLIEPYVFDAKLNLAVGSDEHHVNCFIKNDDEYYRIKEELLDQLAQFDSTDDALILGIFQKMQQSYSLDEGKLKKLDELIKRKTTEKVIIFVKFVKTQQCLQKKYPQSLVITYGKGSLGLNLQEYKNMIFYDKTWNYATLEQAKRRIYRIGQNEDVTYYYLDAGLGLDEMMQTNINNKGYLLQAFKAVSLHKKKEQLKKLL